MNLRTWRWAALGVGTLLICWLLLPQNPVAFGWADSPVPTPTATQVPPAPTATSTQVPPSPTSTATQVPPSPTSTQVPPTPTVTATHIPEGATPTATQVTSPEWVNFYGMNSTLDGQPLPIGSVVEAWTGGHRCGSFIVHTLGWYGLLPCYRAYDGAPGANPGDVIAFTVNGWPATPMGPDQPIWTAHGDRKHVELAVVGPPPTSTPTLTPVPSATATHTQVPPTPTGTVLPTATATPIPPGPTATATATQPPPPWTPWPPPPTWTPWPPPWTPWPPPWTPVPPYWPPTATPTPQPCWEAVVNGSFLNNEGWVIGPDPRPAAYTTERWHSGGRAMFLGNMAQPDTVSHSAIRQVIEIPGEATYARLSFWYWPWSEDTAGSDHQELALLDPATGHTVWTAWRRVRANEQVWLQEEINLLPYRNRRLELYFNVYNDGTGGRTAMYLDDVSLVICRQPPPPPTPPTPTPTSTWPVPPTAVPPTPGTPPPTPLGHCVELVQNGTFDPGQNVWRIGSTPYEARYASEQYHSAPWAMYLGFRPNLPNQFSFSSVRQQVQIPADAPGVNLVFWYFPISEAGAGRDEQQFVLLQSVGEGVIAKPWYILSNAQTWLWQSVDLSPYRGRTLDIYFGVVNDGVGGRTGMYLDDVSILACWPATPTPTLPPPPTDTPIPTPTPTLVSAAQPTATRVGPAAGEPSPAFPTPTGTAEAESRGASTRIFFIGLLVVVVAVAVALLLIFKRPR